MRAIQAKLDYGDAIADWFMDLADDAVRRERLEDGLHYLHRAAIVLSRQNRTLTSVRLEAQLRAAAARLDASPGADVAPAGVPGDRPRCLHVMSEALPLGGVTAMATRWMGNDRSGRVHSVAILSNDVPVPVQLREAARATGGEVHVAATRDPALRKAAWLRSLTKGPTCCVILHVDVSDVVCAAAFGVPGGPPVLLVNHSAHLFWTGASIADVVLNVRGSALEGIWAARHRGAARFATMPIPLADRTPAASGSVLPSAAAKHAMGLPGDAVVMLTVGASFKYIPANGLDFIDVYERILRERPEARLLVVGVREDDRWRSATARSGGRILAVGTLAQAQLASVHAATDIYVEGFPFGTTTALLEAGLCGIPVVLSPAECPPPYGSDGVALDDTVERPPSLEAYKAHVLHLIDSPSERQRLGTRVRASIARHHTGTGWAEYLERIVGSLPPEHAPRAPSAPTPVPTAIHEYWSRALSQWSSSYDTALEDSAIQALASGLRPRLTPAIRAACRDARAAGVHGAVPLRLLVCIFNGVAPVLPAAWAGRLLRLTAFACRESVRSRLRAGLSRVLTRPGSPGSAYYGDYRQAPDARELALIVGATSKGRQPRP